MEVPEAQQQYSAHVSTISGGYGPRMARDQEQLLIAWSTGHLQGHLLLPMSGLWYALSLPLGGLMRPWRSHAVGSRCNVQA